MTIGAGEPIGERFESSKAGLAHWLNGGSLQWRLDVGDDLLGGYATLHFPTKDPYTLEDSSGIKWLEGSTDPQGIQEQAGREWVYRDDPSHE